MIIYDLECEVEHRFEGWFKNADEFTQQQQSGMLNCPMCGSETIKKIPSASHIVQSSKANTTSGNDMADTSNHKVLQMFHDYINKNFDDVGGKFAEEAKKIHFGESVKRNIRGTATADEVKELKEEGVTAVQLPPAPYDKDKLN